jgi:hypothetical protein
MVGIVLGVLGLVREHRAAAQQRADMRDMQLVGFDDLQARSAYQPVIHQQGNRWIAYIGHHGGSQLNPLTENPESNGTSIRRHRSEAAEISGTFRERRERAEAGGAQMVRVCDGRDLPRADKSKVYLLRSFGNSGHEVWDVTEPGKPERVTVVVSGLRQTHKNWWRVRHRHRVSISGDPAWRTTRMTKIYDLSDPAHPAFIRDFGLPGQQPGSTGPVPTELHGPISLGPKANRVYFGYGTGANGIVQIVDREKLLNGPKEPTDENLRYPQISRVDLPPDVGAHTAFPLLGMDVAEFGCKSAGPGAAPLRAGGHEHEASVPANQTQARRDFIAVVGESIANECMESRQMLRMLDATAETRPFGASSFTVPESSVTTAAAAGVSARIPRTRTSRRSTTSGCCSSRTSTPACAPWTSAIRSTPERSGSTCRPSPARPTSAA